MKPGQSKQYKIKIMKVFSNVTHNSISFIGYVFVISTPVLFLMAIKLYQRIYNPILSRLFCENAISEIFVKASKIRLKTKSNSVLRRWFHIHLGAMFISDSTVLKIFGPLLLFISNPDSFPNRKWNHTRKKIIIRI